MALVTDPHRVQSTRRVTLQNAVTCHCSKSIIALVTCKLHLILILHRRRNASLPHFWVQSDKLEPRERQVRHIIYPYRSYTKALSLVLFTCPDAERTCPELCSRACYPHITDCTTYCLWCVIRPITCAIEPHSP